MDYQGYTTFKAETNEAVLAVTFDSKGRLDASEREKAARLAMDTLEPITPKQKSGRVIDVKHKFAKKRFDDRYLWKPAPEIETAIHRAISG